MGGSPEDGIKLDARAFQREHVASAPDEELAGLVFVLDSQAQQPAVVRLREWSTARLAPQRGEVAVDVGSGTGSEAMQLAQLVGSSGRSVGVEPHPGLRDEAQRRATAAGSTAEFIDGDALALPFEDGSVDVLRCERVFQHLTDPQAAAVEFARVLAPGGRLAVLDSDWGSAISTPGDPAVVRRLNESMWARFPHAFAGRHLRTWLQRAGLRVDPDIGSAALVLADELIPFMLRNSLRQAREADALTAAEAEELEQLVTQAAAAGEAFYAVTMFAAVGTKKP